MAANYLDNKPLLELACAKFAAAYIKGKTVEEIRKGVGIVNDFTPEEEELIKQEKPWGEESFWELKHGAMSYIDLILIP